MPRDRVIAIERTEGQSPPFVRNRREVMGTFTQKRNRLSNRKPFRALNQRGATSNVLK